MARRCGVMLHVKYTRVCALYCIMHKSKCIMCKKMAQHNVPMDITLFGSIAMSSGTHNIPQNMP